MFDGFVYLVDTRSCTAKAVFDCETIVPHIDVPVRGGMTPARRSGRPFAATRDRRRTYHRPAMVTW